MMKYTPVQGRGFVRPGETGKQQNWSFSGIKKAAPKWSRLSEQLTRCAVCVCDPKHKHGNDSRYQAGGQCNYPLGSMPRRFSSALANSLNQLPRVRPSEVAASFTCWRSSLLILIWKVGDHPSPRGDLSRFNVDMYVRNSYYHFCYVRTISVGTVKSKAPQVSLPLAGLLTTNDSNSIEVAMRNHTIHPQGRDSHNLNKYIWRFIALSTAQPRVITIEATSEQEARQQSPAGCVMVFAARIRQEVCHA